MAVRLKLDRVGIKLSLRQWSRLGREDRQDLLVEPCETTRAVAAYRARLTSMVAMRTGEQVAPLPELVSPVWNDGEVPAAVVAFARSQNVEPPGPADWRQLSELQRFALTKLSRDNHDNVNFIPAMLEFGLLAQSEGKRPTHWRTTVAGVSE